MTKESKRNAIHAVHESTILIIEDEAVNRKLLSEIFRRHGFVDIHEATNGREGWELICRIMPHLVILDVIMPEMNGEECCRKIRQSENPRIAAIPVLFQTSLDGRADKKRLFDAGATDYISKPIDPQELIARATVHLERDAMNRHLHEFNNRLRQELETARTTQQILIPSRQAMQSTGEDYRLHVDGYYHPSSELGGDIWGFKSLSSVELAVFNIDFSGTG